MNQAVTGMLIRELREKHQLTQAELAQKLCVSDKTISKWETGKGTPDVSLLEPLAQVFGISLSELMSGNTVRNVNVSSNILRSKFYVCPVCGNVLHSMGEAVIHCHGMLLEPLEPKETDEEHMLFVEGVEDEYYVRVDHEMTKQHYISFAAALSPDRMQMVRLYPEGNAEARFQMRGVKKMVFYCSKDGLFSMTVHRAIHGRPGAYDDTQERRELEQTAQKLFG